jgi:hypothetical protein
VASGVLNELAARDAVDVDLVGLDGPSGGGRPRPGALPQHRRRQATTEDPADPASAARASSKPGTAASPAPMESR